MKSVQKTICLLSGEKDIACTHSLLVWSFISGRPVLEFQTWTAYPFPGVSSSLSTIPAIQLPSGETQETVHVAVNVTAREPSSCRFDGPDNRAPVSVAQTHTFPPYPTETIVFPLGENPMKRTSCAKTLKGPWMSLHEFVSQILTV